MSLPPYVAIALAVLGFAALTEIVATWPGWRDSTCRIFKRKR